MKKLLIILPLLMLSSCNILMPGETIEFETMYKGDSGYHTEEAQYIIRNTSDLGEMWNISGFIPLSVYELPEIDFEGEMLIAVFMGRKPTTRYEIEITKIVERENYIDVYVKERTPGIIGIAGQAVTSPHHIVKISKTDKEIRFR